MFAQIYNRKQMLEETHIEPGWAWNETQARALMMRPVHYVQFVKYDVTVSFMAQVLDTVTYLVPQVLDTAS